MCLFCHSLVPKLLTGSSGSICGLYYEKFQRCEAFIKMVQILYANPLAMVNTNGLDSRPFPIFHGTRQGSGLSPSLFILSLEPFTQHLQQNSVTSPIRIRQTSHTLSAFADDVLIYMTDLENSLNSLLAAFEDFKQQSGFKINWTKSAQDQILLTGPGYLPRCRHVYLLLI